MNLWVRGKSSLIKCNEVCMYKKKETPNEGLVSKNVRGLERPQACYFVISMY